VYVADAPSGLASVIPVAVSATEYIFWRNPGDVSVGVKAVRTDGVESVMSNVVSKTVSVASASCSASVTIKPRVKAPVLTLSFLKDLF
jgi:hypothetical protein